MTTYCVHDEIEALLTMTTLTKDDVLTFDDGCWRVYAARREIADLPPRRKILFITPTYVDAAPMDRDGPPDLSEHYQWAFRVNRDARQFMNHRELEEMMNLGLEVGMHSFGHDIVYERGEGNPNRPWRMYKLTHRPRMMHHLTRMFRTVSALASPGEDVITGRLRPRTHVEFVEFVNADTERCVTWFRHFVGNVKTYAYPFFERSDELDDALERAGVTELFGERTEVG